MNWFKLVRKYLRPTLLERQEEFVLRMRETVEIEARAAGLELDLLFVGCSINGEIETAGVLYYESLSKQDRRENLCQALTDLVVGFYERAALADRKDGGQ